MGPDTHFQVVDTVPRSQKVLISGPGTNRESDYPFRTYLSRQYRLRRKLAPFCISGSRGSETLLPRELSVSTLPKGSHSSRSRASDIPFPACVVRSDHAKGSSQRGNPPVSVQQTEKPQHGVNLGFHLPVSTAEYDPNGTPWNTCTMQDRKRGR